MIGQNKLIKKLKNLNELPRFMIFSGSFGCGKKTLGEEMSKKFKISLVILNNKVDEIRSMIEVSYLNKEKIIYYIDNGNSMSVNALNSLLKITEETPNNVHIILAVENKELILPTLLSRADVWNFEEYSYNDFRDFLQEDFDSKIDYKLMYPNLSYLANDTTGLLNFCLSLLNKLDIEHIDKYSSKIKLKALDKGYDLIQVNWILSNLCYQYNLPEHLKIINKANKNLLNNYFNKKFIFEEMLMRFSEVV